MSSNNIPNDQDGPSSSLPSHSEGAPKTESAGAAKSPSPAVPSRYVYRDFSHVVPDDGESVLEAITKVAPTNAKHQKLPLKLSAMLEDPEFSHIISWMPHGRSWRILKPKAFVKEVLPKHFDYCNYNSFVRLVNAWGFRRFTSGPDRNSYYHELFLRGLPHLHNKMRRVTGKEKKIPIDQDDEPDLYSISRANPLPCVSQSQANEPSAQTAGDTSAPLAPLAAKSTTLQTTTGPSESSSSALRNALRDPTLDSGSLAESIAQVLEANRIMSEAQNTVNRATSLPLVARSAAAAAAATPQQVQSQWTAALGSSLASLSQVAASQAQQQQQQAQQPAVLPQQVALSAQQQQFALTAQQQQLPVQQLPLMPQQFVTYGALPAAPGSAPQLGAVPPTPVVSAAPASTSVQAAPTPAPVTTADGQQLAVMYIPVYTTVAAAGAQGAIPAGVAQQQQQMPPQVNSASPQPGSMLLHPPQTQAGGNQR